MEVARKLEDICQSLTLLLEHGKVVGFFTKTENAQRINGLVEDIHEALMDYQVRGLAYLFSAMFDPCARLLCNKIFTMRVASAL